MIAERHPDLEADRHAHAVLAVEQELDEARQVQIADLPHPPLDRVLAILDRGLGDRLGVAVGPKFGEVELSRRSAARTCVPSKVLPVVASQGNVAASTALGSWNQG